MTVNELKGSIGQLVLYTAGDLEFVCRVEDARQSWSKPQFQITPVAGNGTRWVEFSSIKPYKKALTPAVNNVTMGTVARLK
jgi:hypothetical protein